MGEKAEVADAHEAWRQEVEQEATQKLLDRKGHQALLVAVSGVSPAEGNLDTLQRDEAVIGNGDTMGIAAEIAENMFWTTEGRFAVDHPVPAEQWAEEGGESLGFRQKL